MHMQNEIVTEYLSEILSPAAYQNTTKNILAALRPISNEFDGICCCGVSGVSVAPFIASQLGKYCIIIRKSQVKTNSHKPVEGIRVSRYIILDDFAESFETVKFVLNESKKFNSCSICKYLAFYSINHISPLAEFWGVPILKIAA